MNIIFILTDQQHYRTHKATGFPQARTPHLDRLAAEGLNFRQHMVANPVCSPSRGAIWTGKLPSETGLCGNGCRFAGEPETFVTPLNEAGYHTAHFGKMHLVPCLNRIDPHPAYGFREFLCGEGDQWLLHDDYNNWFRCNYPMDFLQHYVKMIEAGYDQPHTARIREDQTHSAWVTRHGMDFLDRQKGADQPFFLSLGYFDPHHAFNPCEPYASLWEEAEVPDPVFNPDQWKTMPSFLQNVFKDSVFHRDPAYMRRVIRAYHAMMTHLDDCIGKLLQKLEDNGQLENTLIVYSSDHGEFLGNHGRLFKGGYLLDDLLRVPLFVWHGNPRKRRQATIDSVTSSLDFRPTFLTLAGLPQEPTRCSQAFLDPDLNVHPDGPRGFAVSEWRVAPYDPPNDILSLRTGQYRLTVYGESDEGELYDHAVDPDELNNRYTDPAYRITRDVLEAQFGEAIPPLGKWEKPETLW